MTPTIRHGAFLATLLGVAACAPSTDADPDRSPVPLQKEEVATVTQSAGAAPAPVKVVNTAGDWLAPVPTTLTGTASVSAQQSGPWTVGVSGPVTLGAGSTVTANQGTTPWTVAFSATPAVVLDPASTATVAISNTPAVTVSNTPTVTVANAAANPVPVTVAPGSSINVNTLPPVTLAPGATQATHLGRKTSDLMVLRPSGLDLFFRRCFNATDMSTSDQTPFYVVPAGKVLMITDVSTIMSAAANTRYFTQVVEWTANSNRVLYNFSTETAADGTGAGSANLTGAIVIPAGHSIGIWGNSPNEIPTAIGYLADAQ